MSIGVQQAQETLRTALAMGADRGILVQTDDVVEPLGVAKILAKIVEEEQPQVILVGKQAIDDDSNQTGQMLAALLGWPQATFASKLDFVGARLEVQREVDLKVPLVVRLEGTNVQQGKDILANSGLPIVAANDLGDAAAKIVAEVKKAA